MDSGREEPGQCLTGRPSSSTGGQRRVCHRVPVPQEEAAEPAWLPPPSLAKPNVTKAKATAAGDVGSFISSRSHRRASKQRPKGGEEKPIYTTNYISQALQ